MSDNSENMSPIIMPAQSDSTDTDIIEISIEEIRARGGIKHLGLPKEVEDDLMRQIRDDGLLDLH